MTDSNNDNSNNNEELVLDDVVEIAPDDLSDEQKTFLEEKKADLSDEQAEKFGLEKEPEVVDPDDVKVQTRVPIKKKSKKKDDEPEDDEETDPEDERTIGKVVKKEVQPILDSQKEQQQHQQRLTDQAEVDGYLREKPEFSKYRGVLLKYMANPAYSNIPVSRLINIVAGEDLQKIGAKKEREAAKKAAETKSPGSSARKPSGKGKNWHTAPKDDFQAKRAEVMQRQGD